MDPNKPRKGGKTDWKRVRDLTDEEIHESAVSDPDAPPLTEDQIAELRRVADPKAIRTALGLTQREFSRDYLIPFGTLQDWEQGRYQLDQTSKNYLRLIASNHAFVKAALHEEEQSTHPQAKEPNSNCERGRSLRKN